MEEGEIKCFVSGLLGVLAIRIIVVPVLMVLKEVTTKRRRS